jgi:hypothetical protein
MKHEAYLNGFPEKAQDPGRASSREGKNFSGGRA